MLFQFDPIENCKLPSHPREIWLKNFLLLFLHPSSQKVKKTLIKLLWFSISESRKCSFYLIYFLETMRFDIRNVFEITGYMWKCFNVVEFSAVGKRHNLYSIFDFSQKGKKIFLSQENWQSKFSHCEIVIWLFIITLTFYSWNFISSLLSCYNKIMAPFTAIKRTFATMIYILDVSVCIPFHI